MSCRFLEKINVCFCKAYPVKKMIPLRGMDQSSPCLSGNSSECPVYKNYVSKGDDAAAEQKTQKQVSPIPAGECVWMHQNVVSFRLCTLNYQCDKCQFEQMIQDSGAHYVESPEIVKSIEELKKKPGSQRRCKYVIMGKIYTEPCYRNYECWRCPTFQRIRENIAGPEMKHKNEEGEEDHGEVKNHEYRRDARQD